MSRIFGESTPVNLFSFLCVKLAKLTRIKTRQIVSVIMQYIYVEFNFAVVSADGG